MEHLGSWNLTVGEGDMLLFLLSDQISFRAEKYYAHHQPRSAFFVFNNAIQLWSGILSQTCRAGRQHVSKILKHFLYLICLRRGDFWANLRNVYSCKHFVSAVNDEKMNLMWVLLFILTTHGACQGMSWNSLSKVPEQKNTRNFWRNFSFA